jgi:tRNA A-37 threonylcarbamoyl transferase component Bud32
MARLRVIRVGEGEDGAAWVRALSSPAWLEGSEVLKEDGDVVVRRARVLGRDVVVKRWGMSRPKRRLQAILNATPACRHWRGAERLRTIGVRTAEPYVLLRGHDGAGLCELLVMERLGGCSVLEHAASSALRVREQHAIARAVGIHIAHSAMRGVVNHDGKASNLIVVESDGLPEIAVIDCGDIGGMNDEEPEGSLARLVVEMIGVGCSPRAAVAMRTVTAALDAWDLDPSLSRKAVRNEIWAYVREFIRRHGDPTPRVDPLRRTS